MKVIFGGIIIVIIAVLIIGVLVINTPSDQPISEIIDSEIILILH